MSFHLINNRGLLLCLLAASFFMSCRKDDSANPPDNEPRLIMKFKFDSTQVRLNSQGLPASVPSNHGAQSPRFNQMSAHYIELTPNQFTGIGGGDVLYRATETNIGGSNAIDFSKSNPTGDGQEFFSIPIKDITPGNYEWLRVSLAYQNYDIDFRYTLNGNYFDLSGTIASFIGFNTFLSEFQIKDSIISVNANKLQGYWAFETPYRVFQGQSAGTTTVPNPIFTTSPIPAGSCLVTGRFDNTLTITGNEVNDVIVTVSLSTNKSFEWVENSSLGYFEPADGDSVVDMGIRGMRIIY
ncbi:MAG: hypothetical protein ACK5C5_06750 [Bacteroidota bacterium]